MLERVRPIVLLAVLLAIPTGSAHAEEPTAQRFIGGVADRARRSISVGPMVGAGLAYAWKPGTVEVPISFGVGVTLFKIPIAPSPESIKELIVSRTKAKVAARVKDLLVHGQPAPDGDELARLAGEVAAEVKAEVLGQGRYAGRTLERPRLALALEGAYLPRADAWQVRTTLGLGLSKVTLGPSITGSFADANGLYLGGELAVHLTPRPRPRSHVIDVFLRVDVGVTGATEAAHQVGLGARFLLDLI